MRCSMMRCETRAAGAPGLRRQHRRRRSADTSRSRRPGTRWTRRSSRGHDKLQWERQRDLPNLVYTNGTDWRLYQDGELVAGPVILSGGDLATAGRGLLAARRAGGLLRSFLRWKPQPITSVGALVRAVAPLTRLLRGEVVDQLAAEREGRRRRRGPGRAAVHWPGPRLAGPAVPAGQRCRRSPTGTPRRSRSRCCWRAPRASTWPGQPLHEIGAALGQGALPDGQGPATAHR